MNEPCDHLPRRIMPPDGIRQAIQGMIDDARLNEHCRGRCAPLPVRLHEPDYSGCNWSVSALFTCPVDCVRQVDGLVAWAQQIYNLP
jgi:hypothetical protein